MAQAVRRLIRLAHQDRTPSPEFFKSRQAKSNRAKGKSQSGKRQAQSVPGCKSRRIDQLRAQQRSAGSVCARPAGGLGHHSIFIADVGRETSLLIGDLKVGDRVTFVLSLAWHPGL
jgi:hypothetical protein